MAKDKMLSISFKYYALLLIAINIISAVESLHRIVLETNDTLQDHVHDYYYEMLLQNLTDQSMTMVGLDFQSSQGFNGKSIKVFGVGLPHTNMASVVSELKGLSFSLIDSDLSYVTQSHGITRGLYDQVDAVFNLPSSSCYKDLLARYPNAMFVSTFRNPNRWYRDIESEYKRASSNKVLLASWSLKYEYLFGNSIPTKANWIEKYNEHYRQVHQIIPPQQILHLDGDIFMIRSPLTPLCKFLHLSENECLSERRSSHVISI